MQKLKLKWIFPIVLVFIISSCHCDCIGPSNGFPEDKVCKSEYETIYGQNTWNTYESNMLSNGHICK